VLEVATLSRGHRSVIGGGGNSPTGESGARGAVGKGHGGGVVSGCYIRGIWWRGQDWEPLLERRQALHQPSEGHLVLLLLAPKILQLLHDDLHLLHNLDLDFFAYHRR
jgi:hypothetical protein